jgi:hypothetical protein
MQLKTIKSVLEHKMNDWLSTITDQSLREEVKGNLLVSGGSIASMMLNEPVNDFDVYIKSMDVLNRLVSYYTTPFNLEVLDGRKTASMIANEFEDVSANNKCQRIVALRTVKYDQIKINVNEGFKVSAIENTTDGVTKKYAPVFFSPNAISLTDDLQIVCRFHGDNEQIHKTFDFIHATNYFTFKDGLVTNKEALESLLTKQLKYQGSLYPLTSIIRSKKFINRGWKIGAGEYLKIMFQISELNLKDPDVIEEQLIGVDIAYFSMLIKILRDKIEKTPSFALSKEYLNEIIDRVFNDSENVE